MSLNTHSTFNTNTHTHSWSSRPYDLLLTSFYMQPASATHRSSDPPATYVDLDPHDFDCLVVIVPLDHRRTSVIGRMLHDGHVQAIGFAAIGYVLVLQQLQGAWRLDQRLVYVWLYTLAVCLAQFDIGNHGRGRRLRQRHPHWHSIWHWSIAGFSCVATAALGAIFYAKLVQPEVNDIIDSLAALGESGLTVYVAEPLLDIGDWFNRLEYTTSH